MKTAAGNNQTLQGRQALRLPSVFMGQKEENIMGNIVAILAVVASANIVLSAREVYYREAFGLEKGTGYYWASIAYTGLLPLFAISTWLNCFVYAVLGILLIASVIERTHEIVDEGYFCFLEGRSSRPDEMDLPMFSVFEDDLNGFRDLIGSLEE